MRLTLLGTGTPSPSLRRKSSGTLLEVDGETIVIDHGGGAFDRLVESGTNLANVTHLLISHLHSDHTLDLARLVLQRWDQSDGGLSPLTIIGPAPLAQTCAALFGEGGAFEPDIRVRCEHPASLAFYAARGGVPPRLPPQWVVEEVVAGARMAVGSVSVRVGAAQHMEPLLDCLCYRFEAGGTAFVYSGDTGYSEDFIAFAKGCDVLLAMCQYLDGTPVPPIARASAASHLEVARMAAAAGVRTLVLTHLSEQFDDPLTRARAHKEMTETFSGTVVWGEDLMRLSLDGTIPEGRFR